MRARVSGEDQRRDGRPPAAQASCWRPSTHGDVVIIPAVDRLSRDTTDLLVIARDLQKAGAGLRSIAEPVVDTTSDFAELVLAMLGVAAKLERRRIKERTALGRADAKAKRRQIRPQAEAHGASAPRGDQAAGQRRARRCARSRRATMSRTDDFEACDMTTTQRTYDYDVFERVTERWPETGDRLLSPGRDTFLAEGHAERNYRLLRGYKRAGDILIQAALAERSDRDIWFSCPFQLPPLHRVGAQSDCRGTWGICRSVP